MIWARRGHDRRQRRHRRPEKTLSGKRSEAWMSSAQASRLMFCWSMGLGVRPVAAALTKLLRGRPTSASKRMVPSVADQCRPEGQ